MMFEQQEKPRVGHSLVEPGGEQCREVIAVELVFLSDVEPGLHGFGALGLFVHSEPLGFSV
jgi:hypothetical protein